MTYSAVIQSMTAEGIRDWRICDHRHKTQEAAWKCRGKFWHRTFGTRMPQRGGTGYSGYRVIVREEKGQAQ